MKYYLAFIILFIFPVLVHGMSAESYVVMDASNKRVLDGKNIEKQKLIASTSKIMTALIILENKDLNEIVTVDERVLKAYGSMIYVEIGEKISINDLLYGLLLRSGNDAALLLALTMADSMTDFAKIMNQFANRIGMNNTIFYNSSGLENEKGIGNLSTAYDMALLMQYAINNPLFLKISSTKKYSCKTNQKSYVWHNKNKLLNSYDKLIAGKTGYTIKAKRTLVTAAENTGKRVIIVTLNDGNDFFDHLNMYNSIFKNYFIYNPCQKIKKINDFNKKYQKFDLNYNEECPMLFTKDEVNNINIDISLFKGIKPINNEVIGEIDIKLKNSIINQLPIKALMVKKKGIWIRLKEWLFD